MLEIEHFFVFFGKPHEIDVFNIYIYIICTIVKVVNTYMYINRYLHINIKKSLYIDTWIYIYIYVYA